MSRYNVQFVVLLLRVSKDSIQKTEEIPLLRGYCRIQDIYIHISPFPSSNSASNSSASETHNIANHNHVWIPHFSTATTQTTKAYTIG